MSTNTTPINVDLDLDAELGLSPRPTAPKPKLVRLFGREWHVKTAVSSYAMSNLANGDPGDISRFLAGAVIDEEKEAWTAALSERDDLDPETLGKILGRILEVVVGGPQVGRRSASPSPSKRTSSPKSRAR